MPQVFVITKWRTSADRLAHIGVTITMLVVSISFVLGLLAALLGSFLTEVGDGPGGGWGIPDLVLTPAMLLGVPSLAGGSQVVISVI